jgi:hypothetical protein
MVRLIRHAESAANGGLATMITSAPDGVISSPSPPYETVFGTWRPSLARTGKSGLMTSSALINLSRPYRTHL